MTTNNVEIKQIKNVIVDISRQMYLADEYTEKQQETNTNLFEKLMFNMQNEETTWS